jgi:hypothetical protein
LKIWDEGRGFEAIRAAWTAAALGIGGQVTASIAGEATAGIFAGIAPDGALLLRQLERQFEAELRLLSDGRREAVLGAADIITSFEAFDLVTERQGRDPGVVASVMHEGLTALFRRR